MILQSINADQLENVNDEWVISPLNKIPIRASKILSEKSSRKNINSMQDYSKLK